ncbi:MAG: RHS repeat-associated core domain-containing protein [Bacteroidales bacterium]|nr:RHS repeat-associated core domain-containing protein [Bacteroidales bacterium]
MKRNLNLFNENEGRSPLVPIIHNYDYDGNRTKRYDPVHAANSELYTYDNLGQIKSLNRGVTESWCSNTAQNEITTVNHSESWNFDQTGNWSQYTKNGNTETRTHNAANELQDIATHDANGNMVLMPGLKGKYDAWNRLVEVRDTSDNLIASYEYNGLNQRIKKTVDSAVTKSFFNENWQEVESVTNNQVTSYVWGLRYIDDLVLREKGEERLYSLADPNWNVVAICDSTGDVQERYTYDAFGKRNVFDSNFTTKIGTDFNWNRAFTGQVLDLEIGLMLYRNRYYSTELGRFITRDPIGYNAEDVNIYRYVTNSTSNIQDAMGLAGGKHIDDYNVCRVSKTACDRCGLSDLDNPKQAEQDRCDKCITNKAAGFVTGQNLTILGEGIIGTAAGGAGGYILYGGGAILGSGGLCVAVGVGLLAKGCYDFYSIRPINRAASQAKTKYCDCNNIIP